MIPGTNLRLLAPASGGYVVDGSGLFDGSSGRLSRTFSATGSRVKWTFETILKNNGKDDQALIGTATDGNNYDELYFAGDVLRFDIYHSAAYVVRLQTTAIFRDPSAYYHIVLAYDSGNSTAGNRVKLYINGTRVTDWSQETYPPLNYSSLINTTTNPHEIGRTLQGGTSYHWMDSYLARSTFVNNEALDATDFGEVTTDGFWQINEVKENLLSTGADVTGAATDNTVSAAVATTYTFSNQAIGTASSDRVVIVNIGSLKDTSAAYSVTSVTIGGVAATKIHSAQTLTSFGLSSYYATVPTGTTANIVIVHSANQNRVGIQVVTTTNVGEFHQVALAEASSGSDPLSFTVDAPAGSLVIGYVYDTASSSQTWTELTENFDEQVSTTHYHSGAIKNYSSAATPTITADPSGSSNTLGIVVVFRPAYSGWNFGTNGFLLEGGDDVAAGIDSSVTPTPATYIPDAARFDGSGEYGTRTSALAGTSSSETAICGSVWLKFNDTGQSDLIFGLQQSSGDSDHPFNIRRHSSSGSVAFRVWKFGVAVYVAARGNVNLDDGLWHHVAWNINLASGPTVQIYIDGVDAKDPASSASTGNFVGNSPNIGVGIDQRNSNEILNGDMADLWILLGENIDLSVPANLAKFITTDGQAVDLGSTGTNPNGSTPTIFMHLDSGETPNNWMTNAGDGGAITLAGTLTSTPLVPTRFGNSFYKSGIITGTNDSPTDDSTNDYGDYCTLNPIDKDTHTVTYSNGNKTALWGANAWGESRGTFSIPKSATGKFYVEFKMDVNGGTNLSVGIKGSDEPVAGITGIAWRTNGTVYDGNGGTSTETTYTTNDIIGLEFDMDNDVVKGYKNSASVVDWTLTGKMAGGNEMEGDSIVVRVRNYATGEKVTMRTDPVDWEYQPAGTIPWNTANLPEPAIADPTDHFHSQVVTHDGSSTASTCTFNLDTYEWLALIKNTTGATEKWYWIDSLRGVTKYLSSNDAYSSQVAEQTDANVLTVSGTTFTLGSTLSNKNYLVEFHKAGLASATASNTTGSINTTATSVNTTSGFSLSTYTGTGAAATMGHGLSSAPEYVICRQRSVQENWGVWHIGFPATQYLFLNNINALQTNSGVWNDTLPTSSVISYAGSALTNQSTNTHVNYSWHSVDGYSSFGSFEGNASTDGPMINVGFHPKCALYKWIDGGDSWVLYDDAFDPINGVGNRIHPNKVNILANNIKIDRLSNGSKIYSADGSVNSASTIIYSYWGGTPIQGNGTDTSQGRAR